MNISEWLEKFRVSWLKKDIPAVLDLFADDVEYWETPYKKLSSKQAIGVEWQVINNQENLVLTFTTFASEKSKHAVRWTISYDQNGKHNIWAGTYFIMLNNDGKCVYFYQTGEQE